MLINGKQFLVVFHKEPDGCCEKCYFEDKIICPRDEHCLALCLTLGENAIFMEDSRANK